MPDEPYAEEILGGYDGIHLRGTAAYFFRYLRAVAHRKARKKHGAVRVGALRAAERYFTAISGLTPIERRKKSMPLFLWGAARRGADTIFDWRYCEFCRIFVKYSGFQ